jgi:hypothetical protein
MTGPGYLKRGLFYQIDRITLSLRQAPYPFRPPFTARDHHLPAIPARNAPSMAWGPARPAHAPLNLKDAQYFMQLGRPFSGSYTGEGCTQTANTQREHTGVMMLENAKNRPTDFQPLNQPEYAGLPVLKES